MIREIKHPIGASHRSGVFYIGKGFFIKNKKKNNFLNFVTPL